jgi:hypothetical protein
MSLLCFLSQYLLLLSTRKGWNIGWGKSPNYDRAGGQSLRVKKKERRRRNGRPSAMSLSEGDSSVSCIDVPSGIRSIFFQDDTIKEKAKKSLMHTTPEGSRHKWTLPFWP